jgi:hypothetical protein
MLICCSKKVNVINRNFVSIIYVSFAECRYIIKVKSTETLVLDGGVGME